MAQKYFSFGKFNDQQTRTFIVGNTMGGVAIATLPAVDLLAGVPIHNANGTVGATDDFSAGIEDGHEYLLAEDYKAGSGKIVCYEITGRDIDSLEERPKPRPVKDLDGNQLFI